MRRGIDAAQAWNIGERRNIWELEGLRLSGAGRRGVLAQVHSVRPVPVLNTEPCRVTRKFANQDAGRNTTQHQHQAPSSPPSSRLIIKENTISRVFVCPLPRSCPVGICLPVHSQGCRQSSSQVGTTLPSPASSNLPPTLSSRHETRRPLYHHNHQIPLGRAQLPEIHRLACLPHCRRVIPAPPKPQDAVAKPSSPPQTMTMMMHPLMTSWRT
jgi:hypothetical protein